MAAKLRDGAAEQTEKFGWKGAAERYARELARQHSTMRIIGKPDPVPLDDVFTDVDILSGSSSSARFPIHELRQREFDRFERYLDRSRQRRTAGLDLVKEGRNLFILGKPGAGKTTFLRHVVLETLRGQIERTPIFISLKRWSTSEHQELTPYLVEQFDICGFPDAEPFVEQLLEQGKAIVLFDGLDEVNMEGDQRRTLVRLLQDFADQYSGSQVLITCRIAASEYQFENFSDVEVADFERDQIHAYAEKWFGSGEDEEREETRKTFIAELYRDENQGIRELCSSPLLLAMLCLAYEETGYFPKRRAELYDDATEMLLRKWDAKRNIRRDEIYRELSHKRRQQLLSYIAIQTFEAGEYFIERRVLEHHIEEYLRPLAGDQNLDVDVVLRSIAAQHGFLVERAYDIYSFSHLTFQEYFAAKYVVDNEARGAATRLVHSHLTDKRWREVYLLTASLLYDADTFFGDIQQAIEELVRNCDCVQRLLKWADKQANQANVTGIQLSEVRAFYLAIGIDADPNTSELDYRSEVRDQIFSLASRVDCSRELNLAIINVQGLAMARITGYSLPINLSSGITLAQSIVSLNGYRLGSDYLLEHAWQSASMFALVQAWGTVSRQAVDYQMRLYNLIYMIKQADDAELAGRLQSLVVPDYSQYQAAWRSFSVALRVIIFELRDIGHLWRFDLEQWKCLRGYFAANKLLVDCLDLAYVSDKQAILDGLLTPPGGQSS